MRSLLVHPESKTLCLAVAKSSLPNTQSYRILFAHLQEAVEIVNELIEIVAIPYPIVNVVAMPLALHFAGGGAIGALRFSATVLLPKWQSGRLDQAYGGPDRQGLRESGRGSEQIVSSRRPSRSPNTSCAQRPSRPLQVRSASSVLSWLSAYSQHGNPHTHATCTC